MPPFRWPPEDPSGLGNGALTLVQPFTVLGFDTLAHKVSLDGRLTLEHVTDNSHIVHLGRPLFGSRYDAGDCKVQEDIVMFAVRKLLNAELNTQELTRHQELACLSQRLPIQFDSTTFTSHAAGMKQVEEHLRVCLKVDAAFESMETVSPSEPLLSEAAYLIMALKDFNPVEAFKSILESFDIEQGDCGEHLALLLLTLARDQAVGHPGDNPTALPESGRFFSFRSFVYGNLFKASVKSLTSETVSALKMLKQDFADATMHFNHFIKLYDFSSVNKGTLLRLMTRGAGVLCANGQTSVDAVNSFLISGTELRIDNLGVILYQIKSNADYNEIPQPKLFQSMDPYDLKILQAEDTPIPVIRIFFALAAETPSLHVTRHPPSSTYGAVIYDIWSAGLSSEFLSPITPATADTWKSLLQASYGWQATYKAETDIAKELRRSMNPGAAADSGHWSAWAVQDANRAVYDLSEGYDII
ncbi:hypothetical protein M413DRAFT_29078 [Hebeloma cylindrosporum]|uniref:Uncharacterized protein n=1 Tax=Hebeloma cylindrosporum TaxID=76867 RepID=A0A0C2YFS5_HEBCY|nr:hypothetical protein M413DRAFT_29078 [Hebeloma cylindrosporum h7]